MYSAWGVTGRVVSFKLSPGDDLAEGLTAVCEKYQLKNGVILNAFGSLQSAVVKNVIHIPDVKYEAGYGEPVCLKGPIELVGTQGVICHTDDGGIQPHIHISLSDKRARGFGGHLCPGTKVLITVEGAILEFNNINMRKLMDTERNILAHLI